MLKNSKKEAKPQSKPKKHDFEKGKKSVTLNSYPATTSNFTPSLKKDSQYFQNLVSIYKSDSTKYHEYKLFWYFDKLYAIDDCVMVDIYDDESVGQITKIMRVETEELFLLLIEVQWFFIFIFLNRLLFLGTIGKETSLSYIKTILNSSETMKFFCLPIIIEI